MHSSHAAGKNVSIGLPPPTHTSTTTRRRSYSGLEIRSRSRRSSSSAELRRLLDLPYSELIKLVRARESKEVVGEDGISYRVEIEAIWDITGNKDVRVIVSVDDGGWRALRPLTEDFVMRPDGSFVEESTGDC
jgi:hypothetical protein